MKKGSPKKHLQKIALEIFRSCRQFNIKLEVEWLSRSDPRVEAADTMSRFCDLDDWGLSQEAFKRVTEKAKYPFFVDLFANEHNFRVDYFFSSLPSLKAISRDAFGQDWSRYGFAYLCPPIKHIHNAINHLITCKSVGVLVCPNWPSANFWKFICDDGVHYNNVFEVCHEAYLPLRSGNHVRSNVFRGMPSFTMLILQYNGNIKNPLRSRFAISHCSKNGCNLCL